MEHNEKSVQAICGLRRVQSMPGRSRRSSLGASLEVLIPTCMQATLRPAELYFPLIQILPTPSISTQMQGRSPLLAVFSISEGFIGYPGQGHYILNSVA